MLSTGGGGFSASETDSKSVSGGRYDFGGSVGHGSVFAPRPTDYKPLAIAAAAVVLVGLYWLKKGR